MKHTRKIAAALIVAMVIAILATLAVIPASAATNQTLYFVPGSDWNQAGAIFRAWTWGGSTADAWVTLTDSNGDGVYEGQMPSDRTDIIFLRAQSGTTGWNGEWNRIQVKTSSGKNCYTVSGWSSGSWSNFNYTVALAGSFNGWSTTATPMTISNGVASVTLELEASQTPYEFKVVSGGNWCGNGGSFTDEITGWDFKNVDGSNCKMTAKGGTYLFSYDISTGKLSVHKHVWSDATCTEPQKCSCGATQGSSLGHKEETIAGKAATCLEKGLTDGKKCTVCGVTTVAQTEIPVATTHKEVNGCCEWCGKLITPSLTVKSGSIVENNGQILLTLSGVTNDKGLKLLVGTKDDLSAFGHAVDVADDGSFTVSVDLARLKVTDEWYNVKFFYSNGAASIVTYGQVGKKTGDVLTSTGSTVTVQTWGDAGILSLHAQSHIVPTSVKFEDGNFVFSGKIPYASSVTAYLYSDDENIDKYKAIASLAEDGSFTVKIGLSQLTAEPGSWYRLKLSIDNGAMITVKNNNYFDLNETYAHGGRLYGWASWQGQAEDVAIYYANPTLTVNSVKFENGKLVVKGTTNNVGTLTAYLYDTAEGNDKYNAVVTPASDGSFTAEIGLEQLTAAEGNWYYLMISLNGGARAKVTYQGYNANEKYSHGLRTYKWEYWEGVAVSYHDHKVVVDSAKAPDCVNNGLTEGKHCSECNYVIVAQTSVPALGHKFDGTEDNDCNVCGAPNPDYVAPHVHSYVESVTTPAGCESEGVKTFTCSCEATYTEKIPALGHDLKDVEALGATCTTPGYTAHKDCSRCDYTEGKEIIDAKNHSETIIETQNATCTVNGKTETKCKLCGEVIYSAVLHAPGHKEVTVNGYPATCTTAGLTNGKKCSVCQEVITAQTEIAAKGHINKTTTTVESTCSVAGSKTVKCNDCGETLSTEALPLASHVYVEGSCSACGAKDPDYVAPVKVTLSVPNGVAPVEMGAGNLLPTAGAPSGYTFAGWSEVIVGETTAKPTILKAGDVYSGSATVLFALYTRTDTTPGVSEFVKVTSAPSDWSGSYLIVYETGKVAFNGALTSLDGKSNTVSVTISNSKIAATDTLKKSIFVITKSGSGYTIKSASGYYIGQNSNANGLASSTSTAYSNTISLNGSNVNIISSGGAYLRYNSASDNLRFRYYKSSSYTNQKAIQLYKLNETAGTSITYYLTLSDDVCDHNYDSVVTKPTCTTAGYTTHTCTKCEDSYVDGNVAALGHSYVETSTTAATCVAPGTKLSTCSTCGDKKTETIKALGHNYVDGVCSRCSAVEPEETTVTTKIATYATTHNWTDATKYTQVVMDENVTVTVKGGTNTGKYYLNGNDWRIYQSENATITVTAAEGYIIVSVKFTYTVNNTGYLFFNGSQIKTGTVVTVNAESATFNAGNTGTATNGQVKFTAIEVVYAKTAAADCEHKNTTTTVSKEATCTKNGATTITCNDCGATVGGETIPATGHNYVDYVCSNCGTELPDELIFDFGPKGEEKDADGNSITSVKTYTEGDHSLVLTPDGKVYTAARDVKGNVCIKLGSSSAVGSITFTVPDEVLYVIVNVAGYKANTVTIKVNGAKYDITTFGNNGEYTPIRVDTTTNKTVTVETTSDGYRAMIDSIVYGFKPCAHTNVNTTTVDATCLTAGSKTVTCKDCGEVVSTETIAALGHDLKDVAGKDADCLNPGYTAYKDCSRCDHIEGKTVIDALGHNVVTDNAVAPDCTNPGLTAGEHCTRCDYKVAQNVDPALGHDLKDVAGKDADCLNPGYTAYKDCSRCDHIEGKTVIDALGHTFETVAEVPATCTLPGIAAHKHCTTCDISFGKDVTDIYADGGVQPEGVASTFAIPAKGHSWTNASCTAPKTCSACGATEGEALGHSYNAVVTDPTFDSKGYTTHTCSKCNDTYVDSYVDALVAVAKIGDKRFETLQQAFDAAVDGDTIVLVADVAASKYIDIKTENNGAIVRAIVLDLNGHTISPADGYNYNTGYPLVFVGINQTLTIKGEGTITAEKKVTVGVYGTLNVEGGNIVNNGTTDNDAALSIYYWNHDLPSYEGIVGGTAFVEGGNFVGYIHCDPADEDGKAVLEISGGSFTTDVSDYCADGFDCKPNADGTLFGVEIHVHTAGEAVEENRVESTCKVAGSYDSVVYCTGCGEKLFSNKVDLDLAPHTEVIDNAVDATCTAAGKTEGKHCSVCNEVIVAQQTVPAAGHTFGEVVAEVPATCTAHGYQSYKQCTVCKFFFTAGATEMAGGNNMTLETYLETIKIKALGHDLKDVEGKAADCLNPGYTAYKDCSRCDHIEGKDVIDALGHDIVADKAVAPDCVNTGLTAGEHCTRCDYKVAQTVVPALGHTAGEAVKENEIPATCKAAGSYDSVVKCSVCGEELSRTKHTVDQLPHTEVVDDAVAAGCETTGLTEGKHCSVCNEVIVAQTTTPAIGHSYSEVVTPPTFTDKGYTTHTCSNCNHSYVDSYVDVLVAAVEIGGVKYTSIQAAIDAANAGDRITLVKDVELDASIVLDGSAYNVILDLAGHTITAGFDADIVEVILAKNGAKLTITGNGTMKAVGEAEHVEVISSIDGAVVTIENGTFVSDGCTTIYATRGGTVNIMDGSYEAKSLYNGMRFLLDINEKEDVLGEINVYGGVFADFNPANHRNDGSYSNKLVGEAECVGLVSAMATYSRSGSAGTVYYVGQDAFAEVIANAKDGDVIVLESDITLDETVVVNADITLELNGKSVTMDYSEKVTKNHAMIVNNANLTINGEGKLSYKYSGANIGTTYSTNTITSNPGSTLIVNGGDIENLTYDSSVIAYAIDGLTNGTLGDVNVIINGGTISSMRQAIRIFANSNTNTGTLKINGGDITGRVIVQNANATANKAVLEIAGGKFTPNSYKNDVLYVGGSNGANMSIDAEVSGGSFLGEITSGIQSGFISGGSFSAALDPELCADGFACVENPDGTFGIMEAEVTINGVGYATLGEALAAASAGDTIVLLKDVNAGVITLDKNITIDGASHTLAAAIVLGTANTTININNTNLLGIDGQSAVITITADAKLTVNGGSITSSGNGQFILLVDGAREAYAYVDAAIVSADGEIFSGDPYEVAAYFRSEYADELVARGYLTKESSNGMIVVKNTLPYHIGADGYWYFNGEKTEYKAVATDGLTPYIGANGNWWIGEGENADTGIKASGTDGKTPHIGANGNWFIGDDDTGVAAAGQVPYIGTNGNWWIGTTDTEVKASGEDGKTPYIGDNGNWWIGDTDTGKSSKGEDGKTPTFKIENGHLYASFDNTTWTDLGKIAADTPYIGDNGNWFIGDTDTGVKAEGTSGTPGADGKTPYIGANGNWWIDNTDTGVKATGADGKTPYIGANGNWWIDNTDTGVKAEATDGVDGETPYIGTNGNWWIGTTDTGVKAEGTPGTPGADGKTPHIGANGNWWIGNEDTGVKVTGADGKTPYVGDNGNWFIGDNDTGVKAEGTPGTPGADGKTPYIGDNGNWFIGDTDTGVKAAGAAGADGKTPYIKDGNWWIGTTDTGVKAEGIDGEMPSINANGNWVIGGIETDVPAKGQDGKTPHIGENGNWWIGSEDTGVPAKGQDGKTPAFKIEEGHLFVSFDGENWEDLGNVTGENGKTPYIGENGNWWIGDTDTGVKANGANGTTPHIGENGNWWIGDTDTGISAQGKDGNSNNEIILICIGIATLCAITTIVAVATRRRRSHWWILS